MRIRMDLLFKAVTNSPVVYEPSLEAGMEWNGQWGYNPRSGCPNSIQHMQMLIFDGQFMPAVTSSLDSFIRTKCDWY